LSKDCSRLINSAKNFSQRIKRSATQLDKVAVHRKCRQSKRRNKRRQLELTTNFDTFKLLPIICKMKIVLLILCLAVVYGSCRTYNEENVDVVKEIQSKSYNNVLII